MNEEIIEQTTAEEEPEPAKLNLFLRTALALETAVAVYLIIATHYLLCVRAAHFLGDPTYIPPSLLYYTGVIFRTGEVETLVQLAFFVGWLIFVLVSCAGMFLAALGAGVGGVALFTSEKTVEAAIWDSLGNGFAALVPVLLLSLLTLVIMPLESTHLASDSASLTQIGALMPFPEFLFTMCEAPNIIFLVCFFVVVTVAVAYLLSFILPDDGIFFLLLIFAGVVVGLGAVFGLGHYIYKGLEFLKTTTGNAYLTLYAVFGVYSLLCAVFILPALGRRPAKRQRAPESPKKSKRSKKSKNGRPSLAAADR